MPFPHRAEPSETPSKHPLRLPASTPLHNSTMMPGAAAGAAGLDEGDEEAMVLDFSQIENIEDDDVLQRAMEESLNMSKREEEQEEDQLKRAIEASLREVKVKIGFYVAMTLN